MAKNLVTVLLAGAEELMELSAVADQLGSAGIADVERWQALDRMSQHLDGMATFLAGLAEAVPDAVVDLTGAFARLKTNALADRLAGQSPSAEFDSGTLEMFDA